MNTTLLIREESNFLGNEPAEFHELSIPDYVLSLSLSLPVYN